MSVENVSRTNATTSPKNPKSNGTHDQPPSSTSGIHLLYGLAGNLTGFLDEFEVSLKSVLLNSPLDYNLTIHLIVDEVAHAAASHRILHQAQLEGSVWRNAITILLPSFICIELIRRHRHVVALLELVFQEPLTVNA